MAKRKVRRKRTTTRRQPRVKPVTNGHIDIDDGVRHIFVNGKEELTVEMGMVRAVSGPLEQKHFPGHPDIVVTPEFLQELTEGFEKVGYKVTSTVALHLWHEAIDYYTKLQKKTSVLLS